MEDCDDIGELATLEGMGWNAWCWTMVVGD